MSSSALSIASSGTVGASTSSLIGHDFSLNTPSNGEDSLLSNFDPHYRYGDFLERGDCITMRNRWDRVCVRDGSSHAYGVLGDDFETCPYFHRV